MSKSYGPAFSFCGNYVAYCVRHAANVNTFSTILFICDVEHYWFSTMDEM